MKPEPLPQRAQPERLPTIDGKEFDRLIVVPVIKNDGYEKTVSFQAKFYRNDSGIMEVKNLTKPDMARMGIESKGIESRKVISPSELHSSQIESPLRHAERTLNEFKASMVNKEFSADEFRAIKAERARLEDNVKQIRKTIDANKPTVTNKLDQSASKGFSM